MLIEHQGNRPNVHPTAFVAPNAVLSGDVRVGPGTVFGANRDIPCGERTRRYAAALRKKHADDRIL
jgi:hypothetical protein